MKITIKTLKEVFPGINNDKKYEMIKIICNRRLHSKVLEKFESNKLQNIQYHNFPNNIELKFNALNKLINGCGVKLINDDDIWIKYHYHNCIGIYIDMNDKYAPTIIYDTRKEVFLLNYYQAFIREIELNKL